MRFCAARRVVGDRCRTLASLVKFEPIEFPALSGPFPAGDGPWHLSCCASNTKMAAVRLKSNERQQARWTKKNRRRLPVRSSRPQPVADLKTLFEAAPFGVLAIGADGRIGYVNPRQCENSQLPREFFIG